MVFQLAPESKKCSAECHSICGSTPREGRCCGTGTLPVGPAGDPPAVSSTSTAIAILSASLALVPRLKSHRVEICFAAKKVATGVGDGCPDGVGVAEELVGSICESKYDFFC